MIMHQKKIQKIKDYLETLVDNPCSCTRKRLEAKIKDLESKQNGGPGYFFWCECDDCHVSLTNFGLSNALSEKRPA